MRTALCADRGSGENATPAREVRLELSLAIGIAGHVRTGQARKGRTHGNRVAQRRGTEFKNMCPRAYHFVEGPRLKDESYRKFNHPGSPEQRRPAAEVVAAVATFWPASERGEDSCFCPAKRNISSPCSLLRRAGVRFPTASAMKGLRRVFWARNTATPCTRVSWAARIRFLPLE